jgi:hypothetical protein
MDSGTSVALYEFLRRRETEEEGVKMGVHAENQ